MLAFTAYRILKNELVTAIGKDILIVVYGSRKLFYNKNTDLDICVYKKSLSNTERIKIASIVENFHKSNNLKIDTDMKFINKNAFEEHDFIELENNPPFKFKNDKLVFNRVLFTRKFLDSSEMRLRLFLNIFTTKTLLIHGDQIEYNRNINRMYGILKSFISKTSKVPVSLSDAIDMIFGHTQNYKSFLGYNYNNKRQRKFIITQLTKVYKNDGR